MPGIEPRADGIKIAAQISSGRAWGPTGRGLPLSAEHAALSLTLPWPRACLACRFPRASQTYLPPKGARAPSLRVTTTHSLISRIPGTGRRIIHASALTLRGNDTSSSTPSVTCHAGATPPLPSDKIWGNRACHAWLRLGKHIATPSQPRPGQTPGAQHTISL